MKELTIEMLEVVLAEMKYWQAEHPKAKVVYDCDENRVLITYPIPFDFKPRHE